MAKVMAFGSFDGVHKGHLYFLKSAKNLGNELIVVVARDSTIKKVKGAEPEHNENNRLIKIREIDCVDKAVLGSEGDKCEVIENFKPDVIVLGYDQDSLGLEEEMVKRKMDVKIVRLKAFKPEIYKSSKLRGD